MKWLLLVWGLSGPAVEGIFSTRANCVAVADHPTMADAAAINLCVPMRLDDLATDVIIWEEP